MKVLYAITHDTSAQNFLRGQLRFMRSRGLDVHLACSPGPGLDIVAASDGPHIHELFTARDISVLQDIKSLGKFLRLMLTLRPDALHASTPKAALLSLLTAWMTGVPTRMYLIRGLRLETVRGLRRSLLGIMERICCWAATDIVTVSPSLRAEYEKLGLSGGKPVKVFQKGSSNGVDAGAFVPDPGLRCRVRAELDLNPEDLLVTFIGRINRDKGADLFLSMSAAFSERANLRFLMQGSVEDESILSGKPPGPNLIRRDWGDARRTLAATDILVLPTLREGFPNVVLEAACMGIPTVTTTVTGAKDSVIDLVTGILVPPEDLVALIAAVTHLVEDPGLRDRLGRSANVRAKTDFRPEGVWEEAHATLCARGPR